MFKLLLLIILTSLSTAAFSQESFLKACNFSFTQKKSIQNDIKWFKYLYETKDCKLIAQKLSQVKSLSEIVMPFGENGRYNTDDNWTNAFPHLYGMEKNLNNFNFFTAENKIERHQIFVNIEIYRDFSNIVDLSYMNYFAYAGDFFNNPGYQELCELTKLFPNLKTVSLSIESLQKNDECLSRYDIIIRTRLDELPEQKFKSKIIGIEEYVGSLESLANLKSLRYLGYSDNYRNQEERSSIIKENTLEVFSRMSRLTHLSLNASRIKHVSNIKYLLNLNWLSIKCVNNEEQLKTSPCIEFAYVNDSIDFLNSLPWLRYLNLSNNGIKSLDRVYALKRLETLKLRGNSIFYAPDFKTFPSLKYLDLSGNEINKLGNIKEAQNLSFLNLSGNEVKDLTPLSELSSLKYLNVSNNPFDFKTLASNPPPQLKALGANGSCKSHLYYDPLANNIDDVAITTDPVEVGLMNEAVEGDFRISRQSGELYVQDTNFWVEKKQDICTEPASLQEDEDFSKLKNVRVLALRYQNLNHVPKLNSLTSLKYLDLEGNSISQIPSDLRLSQLRVLGLSFNQFQVLPDVTHLPLLSVAGFTGNNIKDISNVKSLKEDTYLLLAGNLIEDVRPLAIKRYYKLSLDLWGNPIKKEYCPIIKESESLFDVCDWVVHGERGEDDIG